MAWNILLTVALGVVMSGKPVVALAPLIDCVKNKPVDVVFLVDTSGSVGQEGLDAMHQFILSVAMRLNLGTGLANDRVAVAHFSDSAVKTIGFKEGTALPAIQVQLAKAPFGGGTHLPMALTFVRENILKFARGAQDANKILIVLTDGETEESDLLSGAGAQIRNDGVLITAVNIKNGDDQQLLTMVGGDAALVRKVEDFADLSSLVAQCTTTATTITTTSTRTATTSTSTATTTTSTTTTSTTTTSTTTTTIFKVALHYRLLAICATALSLICMCMCMVVSCSQQIAQRNKACDEDLESFMPKE